VFPSNEVGWARSDVSFQPSRLLHRHPQQVGLPHIISFNFDDISGHSRFQDLKETGGDNYAL